MFGEDETLETQLISTIRGLFCLHGCWCIHCFLGRPTLLLPVEMYSYTNMRTCVSFVIKTYCVLLHL